MNIEVAATPAITSAVRYSIFDIRNIKDICSARSCVPFPSSVSLFLTATIDGEVLGFVPPFCLAFASLLSWPSGVYALF